MGEFTNFFIFYDTNKVGFLKEGEITYYFSNLNIAKIELLSNDFAKNSIILKIGSFESNRVTFRVKSFETGDFKIPPFQITVTDRNITNTFIIPQTSIKTTPVSINVTNKQPIEEIYDFFDPIWIIFPLILIILSIATFLIIKFFRKRKKELIIENKVDPLEEFITKIFEIKNMKITKENYKEIFVKISEAVRMLLEKLIKLNALEMASSEIISFLKNSDYNEILEIITHIFKICDRVKFAKHIPTEEEKEICISECEELINIFKKKQEEASEVKDEI